MSLPPEYETTVFRLEGAPDPLPGSFAIVTAWNPGGVEVDENLNTIADQQLLAELKRRAVMHFRATGGSPPDLAGHHESGWAVVIPKEAAVELGRDQGQLGIWWIEDGNLILIDCTTGEEFRVAKFSERIVGS